MNNHPSVSLVGAGPGDPELLTLKALKRLQAAEVILSDDLVDPRVLALANLSARVLYVGKRGGCVSTEQRFIHELMIREARAGRRVVRLKGGDPFVFGRGGEEVAALREAGIAVEVVNGITSGLAAPASIGIPVTDRRCTPGVALVTGHCRDGHTGPDWAALARSGLTLVIYMGLAKVETLTRELMDAGLSADMPAAAIASAQTAAQQHLLCRLQDLPRSIADAGLSSPAILVIGEVVRLAEGAQALLAELPERAWG